MILGALLVLVVFFVLHHEHDGVGSPEYYTTTDFESVDIIPAADGEHILLRTAAATFQITNCGWHYLRRCRIDDVMADNYMPADIRDYRHYSIDPEQSCFAIRVNNEPTATRVGCAMLEALPDRVVR